MSRPIPKEIILNGLTETERDFVTSLVHVFRVRMRKESEEFILRPMGTIGDISRASIYEEYPDHKFSKLPDTLDNNT